MRHWQAGGAAWFCFAESLQNTRCGKEDERTFMNFLNKMERKFGRYAIHNLSTYIIGAYVIGYFLIGGDFFAKENAFVEPMTVWRTPSKASDPYNP